MAGEQLATLTIDPALNLDLVNVGLYKDNEKENGKYHLGFMVLGS